MQSNSCQFVHLITLNDHGFTGCILSSVNPDQKTFLEESESGSTLILKADISGFSRTSVKSFPL